MRIVRWFCAWLMLAAGCRWVVSLDQLSAGGEPATSGAGAGGGGGGGGGAAGSEGTIDATPDSAAGDAADDIRLTDAIADVLPPNEPIPVRTTSAPLGGIAVFGDDIYWVEQGPSGGIYHAPKTSNGAALPPIASPTMAFDVAVDGDFVYWSNRNNTVNRKGSDGGPLTNFSAGGSAVRYLAADGQGGIFYSSPGLIGYGAPRQNTSNVVYSTPDVPMDVSGVATTGTRLFWGHGSGISEGTTDSSGLVRTVYMAGPALGVTTDGQQLYWISPRGEIKASPVGGDAKTPRIVCDVTADVGADGNIGADADIAVDNQWVYFTEPSLNRISKCLK